MLDYMTHQVLVYQSSRGSTMEFMIKKVLMDELSLYVYAYPGKRHSLNEEDWSDFLLGFHDKMQDILVSFDYQGPSFWGYLNKVLEWQLLSFYRQSAKYRRAEWICERESKLEFDRGAEQKEFCLQLKITHLLAHSGLTALRIDALKQRLLFLILKNIVFLSEEEFLSVFPLLGPSAEIAGEYRNQLLSVMKRKFDRKDRLELKRCENYSKLTIAEKNRSEELDSEIRNRLDSKIKLYKNRLRKLDLLIKRIPMYPSNEDISDIIHVPKGSIDSGIFYLKNYLKTEYVRAEFKEEELKELMTPGLGCKEDQNLKQSGG